MNIKRCDKTNNVNANCPLPPFTRATIAGKAGRGRAITNEGISKEEV